MLTSTPSRKKKRLVNETFSELDFTPFDEEESVVESDTFISTLYSSSQPDVCSVHDENSESSGVWPMEEEESEEISESVDNCLPNQKSE